MGCALRRWGWRQLLGAWTAYWVALAAVTLGPFIRLVWDLARLPGSHGTVSMGLGDSMLRLSAMRDNVEVWSKQEPVGTIALWIAVPPLALWLLWLAMRPSGDEADHLRELTTPGALPDGARALWDDRQMRDVSRFPAERQEKRRR